MNSAREWQELTTALRDRSYQTKVIKNQYYRRVLDVLNDEHASTADVLLAYRDALAACDNPIEAELPTQFAKESVAETLEWLGLGINRSRRVFLKDTEFLEGIDLKPVYTLSRRRHVHEEPIDPALKRRLNDERYTHYNGVAQQLAIRLALTNEHDSTLIVNLPTGCGKTLIAHAVSLFSSSSDLTLVIVPTIGLAIEQGLRAQEFLEKAGLQSGGRYCWHSGQSKSEHDDIRNRIKEHKQRILFCSPEAACRSLLPTLFSSAAAKSLGSIVIDEAHIIDQWGDDFRPYFQVIASLTRSLRRTSPTGLKCILMSATFSRKSIQLLRELFGSDGRKCVHVNGCFLRPEIQYAVRKVDRSEHLDAVRRAAIALPKPLIIYTLLPIHATEIEQHLRRIGLSRVASFTGQTPSTKKEDLVRKWGNAELDIMVATSAFGLGMDKSNIRSVVHAAVPENIDRFYQEVGRGGRDGFASQSLVIFHDAQIPEARQINRTRLITVELGLEKWKAMWKHGELLSDGSRKVHVSTLRGDQHRRTERNQEWNWRTLLLMQRAGLIRIELKAPSPPRFGTDVQDLDYQARLREYYDNYYDNVRIVPITDDPLSRQIWDQQTRERREYEKSEQNRSFRLLLDWLQRPMEVALCHLLLDNYTIDEVEPEYACGGCPKCLAANIVVSSPTVGYSVHPSPTELTAAMTSALPNARIHQYVYYPKGTTSNKRIVRSWAVWIRRLIESGEIKAISADADVLSFLDSELKTNMFWIGDELKSSAEPSFWPTLLLHTDTERSRPRLGLRDSVKILLAPEELSDDANRNRQWWQSVAESVSLDNFLLSIRR